MSIFDRIKSSLGLQKAKSTQSGHRLGGNDLVGGNEKDILTVFPYEYDVEFKEEGSLGLIVNDSEGKALVTDVIEGGQASKLGIAKFDFIIAIDGNNITSYDDFMIIAPALGRPLRLKLYRDSTKKNMINASGSTSSGKSIALSEKEKDERREAMIKAANDRQSSWDKRLERSAKNRIMNQKGNITDNGKNELINPETLKTIEAAKRKEQALVNSLGYDPFKPLLSSNISGSRSTTGSSELSTSSPRYASNSPRANPSATGESTPRIDYDSIGSKYPSLVDDLDGSFSLMLTSADTGETGSSENVNVCLTTISKLLNNLVNNPTDTKYRSIRINNPALQSKVFVIPGATNVLLAAGFSVCNDSTDGGSSEEYLKHAATEEAIHFCQYTLHRIQEILS